MSLKEVLFVPACVVAIFTGWRVVATSFEVGGRIYACSNGGKVVALDFPLCHFEVWMTAMSSQDSIGMDADRLEFRFRSASDKVDVACSQVTVPSTWLVLSRVSGPTLIQNARWCRERQARVEGPDQTMQMSQLAGIHARWTAATEATGIEDTGPRIGTVAVESHPSNVHLTCEAPLLKAPKAIALQYHDIAGEVETIVVPPVTGGPSVVRSAQAAGSLKALVGLPVAPLQAAIQTDVESSVTEVGHAPEASARGDKTVHVPRRSLEARQYETMGVASVMPQAFVDQVQQNRQVMEDDSTSSVPRSFGPAPVVEELEEPGEV